jgi:thiol-disulfide isomerase/thioredoxin
MLRGVALATGLFLAVCGLGRAADPSPLAGSWKLSIPTGNGDDQIVLLFKITEQDGKLTGEYLASSEKLVAPPKIKSLKVSGDAIQFALELRGQDFVTFDGVLSKDKKKVAGSMSLVGQPLTLTELHPSKLKNLDDPVELARETLTQAENGPALFEAAQQVAAKAAASKVPADEIRAILDRVNKAAASYGPRWERQTAIRLAQALAGQSGYGDIAVAQAKRAERLLTDEDDAATRLAVLEAVTSALTQAGKPEDAKPYLAQITKLETRDYLEYAKTLPFKPEPFAGRKSKSDRTVLVEVFTGAECPPCVAADLAFDGLMKTYKPTEALFLQYHLHVPRPDPLTSPDAMKRVEQCYAEQVEGTPTVFIGGVRSVAAGGPATNAKESYRGLRQQLEAGLEKEAGVKLGLTLSRDDKGTVTAKATVADLATPGEKTMLRFALAEERVRYSGGNGLRYHHMVVRAMPGGVKGFPLTKKSGEQSVSFSETEVRAILNKYLDDFAREEGPFPRADRPLALKNLKLVAFVQNDATREILQATQADVEVK